MKKIINRICMQAKQQNGLSGRWFVAVVLMLMVSSGSGAWAATITSTATGGAWNSGSSWVGGSVPASGDVAVIASTATVTLTTTQSCNTLTVNGTLTIQAGGNLTASNNSTISSTGTVNVQGGTLATASGKSLTVNGVLNISSGTVTVGAGGAGGSDLKGTGASAAINMTGGLLQIGHDYSYDYGLTTYTGGTVEFMGNSGPGSFNNANDYYFYDVIIDAACTSGPGFSTKNGTNIHIAGNLTIATGAIADLGKNSVNDAYTVMFGSTYQPAAFYGSTNSTNTSVTSKIAQFGTANNSNILTITCTVSATAATNPICNGSSTTITANGVGSFTWSPATGLSASTGASVTANPSSNTTYTISATACWSNTYSMTVNPLPTVGFTGTTFICAGQTTALSGTGAVSYSWTGGITNGVPFTPATGIDVYTVTGTDANGCQNKAVATVTVNALPTAAPTNNGAICIGGTVNLTANATGAATYSWSGANLSSTTATNPSATPTVTSTYSLTVTSSASCVSTVYTTTATVASKPTSAPTNDGAICTGGTVNLAANATGGTGAYIYSWSGSSLSATNVAAPTATPTTTTTYSLTVTNAASGCTGTVATTAVTVASKPSAAPTNDGAICTGGTVNLTANATSGVGAYTYTWSGANLSATNVAAPTATPTATTTYSLTVTNAASGCNPSTIYTTTVTVNAKPSAAPTNDGAICTGGTVNLAANATGGVGSYTYTWSGASLSATNVAGPSATPTVTGTYSLTVTNSASGCNPSTVYTTAVTVNAKPSAAPTNDGAICTGGTVNLAANATGGVGAYVYTWSGASLSATNVAAPTATPTATTTYSLTVTNAASGCTSSVATTAVTVNSKPAAAPSTSAAMCNGGTATLSANASGGTGAYSYTWSGANLSSTTVANPTATPTTTTTYSVTVTNTASGCNGSVYTVTTTVNALPAIYSVTGGGAYCQGGAAPHITTSGSSTGVNYQLYRSGTLVSTMAGTGSGLDFGARNPGYVFTVVGVNATTGCTSNMSGSTTVTMNPLPTMYTVTGGGAYCSGGTGVHIGLSNSDAGVSYQLYNSTATGSPVSGTGAALDFGLQTTAGTAYYVIATNNTTGCTKATTSSVAVVVNPLPTAFAVTGGGAYCSGGSGTAVGLYSTVSYTNYQLYRSPLGGGAPTVAVGSPVAGTGTTISFGTQSGVGTYSVYATNTVTGCAGNMPGSVIVTTVSLPAAYSVTGGGSYCSGGTGVHVGLSNSDAGVNYQLYNGASALGSAIAGTGAALDFGIQTAGGTYTVVATNATTGCTNTMSGSVSVTINSLPAAFTVTGGGNYCVGGSGVHVGTSSSASGINYQLYAGGTASGSAVAGTGAALDFGLETATGTYTVVATNATTGCTSNMSNSVTVGTNALPTAYAMTGGGSYCSGGVGLMVYLSSTQYGVNYQLYDNGTPVGSAVAGTGVVLNFGIQTAGGTYSVVGTNATTGCTNNMSSTVGVTVNTLPTVYTMTGGGSYCDGAGGVSVGLSNSQSGVNYQLYNSLHTLTISPVAGTGSAITFGAQTLSGVYSVIATNTTTGCTNSMSGTAMVTVNSTPTAISVTGGGSYCSGTGGVHVGVAGSCTGTDYQLYFNGTAVGSPISGAGTSVDFGSQTAAGSYSVIATNATTGCTATMPGTVTVSVNAMPTISGSIYTVALSSVISLSADVAGGTWSSDVTSIATVASTGDVTGVSYGVTLISYTMSYGCIATKPIQVTITGFKGTQDNKSAELSDAAVEMTVAPNPSRGVFTVKGTLAAADKSAQLEIVDMAGKTVYRETADVQNGAIEHQVQLSASLPNGTYVLSIRAGEFTKLSRVVLER